MSGLIPAIDISGLSVSYDAERKILSSLDLRIGSGIIFGLIGLNGMGKTTLIRAMLGLRQAEQGRVDFLGQPLTEKSRYQIAYLPERFDPPSSLTGHEFLSFTSHLYGFEYKKESGENKAVSLDLDAAALSRRISTYSKGMRQKLGLISNILSNAKIQILDEPMSGLDPRARQRVKTALMSMRAEGRTVFFSSHILSDMEEICDQVAILHHGRLFFEGTPAQMLHTGASSNPEKAFLSIIDRPQAA